MRAVFERKRHNVKVKEQLPEHFADLVLDLEFKVEFNPSKQCVMEIVRLYSVSITQRAIEYYESATDPKYLHYHEKLQKTLKKPEIVKLLNSHGDSENTNFSFESAREEARVRRQARASRKSALDLPILRESENILKQHQTTSHNSGHMLLENLKSQEVLLQSKIRNRRSRYSEKVKSRRAELGGGPCSEQ